MALTPNLSPEFGLVLCGDPELLLGAAARTQATGSGRRGIESGPGIVEVRVRWRALPGRLRASTSSSRNPGLRKRDDGGEKADGGGRKDG